MITTTKNPITSNIAHPAQVSAAEAAKTATPAKARAISMQDEAAYQASLEEQAYYKAIQEAAAFLRNGAVSKHKFIEDLTRELNK